MNYDVIIVGAGISGLVAAHNILSKEGSLNILILEASDNVGGQVFCQPMAVTGPQFHTHDLGAHWISMSQHHVFKLIQELNIELFPQRTDGFMICETGKNKLRCGNNFFECLPTISKIEVQMFMEKLEMLCSRVNLHQNKYKVGHRYLDGINMETYLCGHLASPQARDIFRIIIKLMCGAEPSELSVLYYLGFCNSTSGLFTQITSRNGGAKEFYIKDGCNKITETLGGRLGWDNIRHNEKVVKVSQSDTEVTLRTAQNQYTCSYAIVAIPLAQLITIDFSPPLPDKIARLCHGENNGRITQYVATYSKAHWLENGYSGEVFSTVGPAQWIFDTTVDNKPALTGQLYSKKGVTTNGLDTLDSVGFESSALEQLANIFGPQLLKPVSFVAKTFHSPNPIGVNKWTNLKYLRIPHGRVYFSGSETATMWRNYISGAVQAGQRSALQVLYELRPQSISAQDVVNINPSLYHLLYVTDKKVARTGLNTWEVGGCVVAAGALAMGYRLYQYYYL